VKLHLPFTRKIIAADQSLAEELLELARKKNTSLYSLTNRTIETYLNLSKANVGEPEDAALELILLNTMKNLGFRLAPPKGSPEELEQLGKVLWQLASVRLRSVSPERIMERLAVLLVGDNRVFPEWEGERKKIVINTSSSSDEEEVVYRLFTGIARAASGEGGKWEVQRLEGILILVAPPQRQEKTEPTGFFIQHTH